MNIPMRHQMRIFLCDAYLALKERRVEANLYTAFSVSLWKCMSREKHTFIHITPNWLANYYYIYVFVYYFTCAREIRGIQSIAVGDNTTKSTDGMEHIRLININYKYIIFIWIMSMPRNISQYTHEANMFRFYCHYLLEIDSGMTYRMRSFSLRWACRWVLYFWPGIEMKWALNCPEATEYPNHVVVALSTRYPFRVQRMHWQCWRRLLNSLHHEILPGNRHLPQYLHWNRFSRVLLWRPVSAQR